MSNEGEKPANKEDIPAFNLDAEKSVLSACLLDEEFVIQAVKQLDWKDFFRPSHQQIFWCIADLLQREKSVDIITLREALAKKDVLEDIGGPSYLVGLADDTFSITSRYSHLEVVKRTSFQRGLLSLASEIIGLANSDQDDLLEVQVELTRILEKTVGSVVREVAETTAVKK